MKRIHRPRWRVPLISVTTVAALVSGCGRAEPSLEAADTAAAQTHGPSPEAVAVAAFKGARVLGVPRYPGAEEASELESSMRRAWIAHGESEALFEVRLGEQIWATDESFDLVRAFYLPFMHKVFMDHEMEIPEAGSQRMFTGLMLNADGELVKFTVTRPFFGYPDEKPIDRTVIQMGRVGGTL